MSRPKPLPPLAFLRECFDYNPESGEMVWRTRPRHHFNSDRGWRIAAVKGCGRNAGALLKRPTHVRLQVEIDGISYLVHRIIWKMMTGNEPPDLIDHRDLNGCNNRWDNLRESNPVYNRTNSPTNRNNASGLKGVSIANGRRYRAIIRVNKHLEYLGTFGTKEMAHQAYCVAAQKAHGDHYNSGSATKDAIIAQGSVPPMTTTRSTTP